MSLTYELDIDWNGDGVLDGLNEADRILRFAIDRGRSATIGAPGSGFQLPNVGKLILELDNHDGRYDAWNKNSPFYGMINPGRKMQFRVLTGTVVDNTETISTAILADESFFIRGSSTDYATARGTAYEMGGYATHMRIGQFAVPDGSHDVYRSYLNFDTSNIPDNATITDVKMGMFIAWNKSDADFNVMIAKYDWSGSTDIDTLYDGLLAASTDAILWISTTDINSESYYRSLLSNSLDTTWINKTGYTYYGLLSSEDIANSEPEGYEFIYLAGASISTPAFRPTLHVTYTIPINILFTGFITDIRPNGYNQTATITCEDGAGWLNARTPDIELMTSTDVGGAIEAILTEVGYPYASTIDDGIETMSYYWTSGSNALTELHKLANSDFGRFCVKADGSAKFYSRHNSESISYSATEEEIGTDIYIPMPWDYARSSVKVLVHPTLVGTSDSTLWTLRSDTQIDASDSLELWAEYKFDDMKCAGVDVYLSSWQPTTAFATTDIVLEAFSRSAKITVTNPTTNAETLTELIIKGTPITSPDPITIVEETTDNNLPAEFVFDYPWLSNVNTGKTLAALLLNFLSEPKQYPDITVYNRPEVQLNADLEDRFRLILDTYDIDETYFINKISHWSGASTQELITRIWLTPMLQTNAVDAFRLSSTDYGVLDTNELGF